MTWKSVLEPGLLGRSYVVNVSKRWHLLSAGAGQPGVMECLRDLGQGVRPAAADRLVQATVAHPALSITSSQGSPGSSQMAVSSRCRTV